MNGKGKKVYSKDYTGLELKGGSQPILYNGNIVWTETFYTSNFMETETLLYSIPAVW